MTFWGQDQYTKTAKIDEISSVLGAWGLQKDSGMFQRFGFIVNHMLINCWAPRGTEFRELFNHHLAKMHETGVLSVLDTKWMSPERPQTPVNPNQVFTSLGGDMLFFPFSFLLLGIVGSIASAAIERARFGCRGRGTRHSIPRWNP